MFFLCWMDKVINLIHKHHSSHSKSCDSITTSLHSCCPLFSLESLVNSWSSFCAINHSFTLKLISPTVPVLFKYYCYYSIVWQDIAIRTHTFGARFFTAFRTILWFFHAWFFLHGWFNQQPWNLMLLNHGPILTFVNFSYQNFIILGELPLCLQLVLLHISLIFHFFLL